MNSSNFKAFKYTYHSIIVVISFASIAFASHAQQDSTEDEQLARMQAQLNANVMAQPFLAEKPKEVDAYIKGMLEKKVKPPEYVGSHWRSGYTCRDLLRYNWTQYRNCRYYHRYHGRYYY